MHPIVRIAFWGLAISALGTLPLGVLNMAAMQISVTRGVADALLFSLGVALVEVGYVRISLVGINWLKHRARLLRAMDWIGFGVVAALAISTFVSAASPGGEGRNIILNAKVTPFFLGLSMSAVNPIQIPFWFGWSAILYSKNLLQPTGPYYNGFIAGIGLGTLIGLSIFVLGGQLLVEKLNANKAILNYSMAIVFAITALIMLYRILFKQGAVGAMHSKGVEVDDEVSE